MKNNDLRHRSQSSDSTHSSHSIIICKVYFKAVASEDLKPMTARPMDVTGDYFNNFNTTTKTYFKNYYTMPWNRAQTYIIGIACGYVMHLYRNKDGPKIPIVSTLEPAYWLYARPAQMA